MHITNKLPKQRSAHVSQIPSVLDTAEEAASLVAVSCFLRERLGCPLSDMDPPAVEGDAAVELPPALGGCEERRERRRGGGGGGVSEAAASEAEGAAAAEASASAAAFAARARTSPAIAPASAAGATAAASAVAALPPAPDLFVNASAATMPSLLPRRCRGALANGVASDAA